MRISWRFLLLGATIPGFGCSPPPPSTYASVTSPSGAVTVIKQYKGDEDPTWDIWLIVHRPGGDRHVAVLTDQPLGTGIYGDDGVAMGWDDDRHLTIAWPRSGAPLTGRSEVGGIAITYRPFDDDVDGVQGASLQAVSLPGASIDFGEVDKDTRRTYTTTGKPVPKTKCVVKVSAFDAASRTRIAVEMIGVGIGRPSDPPDVLGMVDAKLSLTDDNGEPKRDAMLTQAKWEPFVPAMGWAESRRQMDSSLLYRRFTMQAAQAMFEQLHARRLTVKLAFGFDQRVVAYDIHLAANADTGAVFRAFNACAAKTTLYEGHLHAPVE
jgi:hypothetical protein